MDKCPVVAYLDRLEKMGLDERMIAIVEEQREIHLAEDSCLWCCFEQLELPLDMPGPV